MPRTTKTVTAKTETASVTPAAKPPAPAGTTKAPAKKVAAATKATPTAKASAAKAPASKVAPPPPRKQADAPVPKITPQVDKWLAKQQAALLSERATYEAQADELKAEADAMARDAEPGDTQFDDESGEGGTTNVDRERDLALASQARAAIQEIDVALDKMERGEYGACEKCGKPIPKARLEAIPWASLDVNCKSGGLSSRR